MEWRTEATPPDATSAPSLWGEPAAAAGSQSSSSHPLPTTRVFGRGGALRRCRVRLRVRALRRGGSSLCGRSFGGAARWVRCRLRANSIAASAVPAGWRAFARRDIARGQSLRRQQGGGGQRVEGQGAAARHLVGTESTWTASRPRLVLARRGQRFPVPAGQMPWHRREPSGPRGCRLRPGVRSVRGVNGASAPWAPLADRADSTRVARRRFAGNPDEREFAPTSAGDRGFRPAGALPGDVPEIDASPREHRVSRRGNAARHYELVGGARP